MASISNVVSIIIVADYYDGVFVGGDCMSDNKELADILKEEKKQTKLLQKMVKILEQKNAKVDVEATKVDFGVVLQELSREPLE